MLTILGESIYVTVPNRITLAFGTAPAPALATAVKPCQMVGAKLLWREVQRSRSRLSRATKMWLLPAPHKLTLEPFLRNVFQIDFSSTREAAPQEELESKPF